MKEDAQLICPIGYDDPSNVWPLIQSHVVDRLPLRDVTWKSPISSNYTTIGRLPIRFLSSSASIFRDVDHPFRWFLAPYVHLYFVTVESVENYKLAKPTIKQWVESHTGLKRASWLIIYAPTNRSIPYETYAKVFNKISSDFYIEKIGDRSVMLNLGISHNNPQKYGSSNSFDDLLFKVRDGIVSSFQQRCALYDVDIRRLDSYRGTMQLDFHQLFLVKESLALMYQMMQLPSEALIQYEELEALLAFVPPGALPETSWPWTIPEFHKGAQLNTKGSKNAESIAESSPLASATRRMIEQYEDMLAEKDLSEMHTTAPTTGDVDSSSIPISNNNNHDNNNSNSNSNNNSSNSGSAHLHSTTTIKEYDGWMSACRNGDEVLHYSMNNARSRVLKNKIGLIELSRYIFARQMYLLFLLKKPVGCAEKGLNFVVSTRVFLERKCEQLSRDEFSSSDSTDIMDHLPGNRAKSLQADLWVTVSAMKIVRACIDNLQHTGMSENGDYNNVKGLIPGAIADDNTSLLPSLASLLPSSINAEQGIWSKPQLDDQTIASLKQLSDLLRYSFSKLCNILPTTRSTRKVAVHVANSFTLWSQFEEARSSLIAEQLILASSYQVTWPLHENGAINLEEMMSSISRRLRFLSTSFSNPRNTKKDHHDSSASPMSLHDIVESTMIAAPQLVDLSIYASPTNAISSMVDPRIFNVSSCTTEDSTPPMNTNSHLGNKLTNAKSPKNSSTLEASIPIHMSRVISELDFLSGRLRCSSHEKLVCADMLLQCGSYSTALHLYCEALNTLSIPPGNRSTVASEFTREKEGRGGDQLSFQDILRSKSGVDSHFQIIYQRMIGSTYLLHAVTHGSSSASDMGFGLEWIELRYWTLRKMLFCCRANEDRATYALLLINLLRPYRSSPSRELNTMFTENRKNCYDDLLRDFYNFDCNDVDKVSLSMTFYDPNSTSTAITTAVAIPLPLTLMVLPIAPYFQFNTKLSSGTKSDFSTKKYAYSFQHDTIPIVLSSCTAGASKTVYLEVTSNFQSTVAIDDIVIVWKSFDSELLESMEEEDSSHTTTSLQTMVDIVNSLQSSDDYIFCSLQNNNTEDGNRNRKSIIHPGKQIFNVTFSPKRLGDFSLHRIFIRIGGLVTFIETVSPIDLRDPYKKYLGVKEVIRIEAPNKIVDSTFHSSTFVPDGQSDVVEIDIVTDFHDFISEMNIAVSVIPEDYYVALMSHTLDQYYDSIGSGNTQLEGQSASRNSLVQVNFTSSSKWECKHMDTVDDMQSQGATKGAANPINVITTRDNPNVLQVRELHHSRGLRLTIPFVTHVVPCNKPGSHNVTAAANGIHAYIQCRVTGSLLRGGCSIPIDCSSYHSFLSGQVLVLEAATLHMTQNRNNALQGNILRQYILQNISTVPIEILGFRMNVSHPKVKVPAQPSRGQQQSKKGFARPAVDVGTSGGVVHVAGMANTQQFPRLDIIDSPLEIAALNPSLYIESVDPDTIQFDRSICNHVIIPPGREYFTAFSINYDFMPDAGSLADDTVINLQRTKHIMDSKISFLYKRRRQGEEAPVKSDGVVFRASSPLLSPDDFHDHMGIVFEVRSKPVAGITNSFASHPTSAERLSFCEVGNVVQFQYSLHLDVQQRTSLAAAAVSKCGASDYWIQLEVEIQRVPMWGIIGNTKQLFLLTKDHFSSDRNDSNSTIQSRATILVNVHLIPFTIGHAYPPPLEIGYKFVDSENNLTSPYRGHQVVDVLGSSTFVVTAETNAASESYFNRMVSSTSLKVEKSEDVERDDPSQEIDSRCNYVFTSRTLSSIHS